MLGASCFLFPRHKLLKSSRAVLQPNQQQVMIPRWCKRWELDLSQVAFEQVGDDEWTGDERNWPGKLESIVDEAVKTLGVKPWRLGTKVSCELQKVLLYEEGGFFKKPKLLVTPEKDFDEGMFATLAIQLPSCFEGGAMTIEYGGTKHRINLAGWSESTIKWTAWGVGSQHEIEPIAKGNRLVLVYNLRMTTPTKEDKKPYCPSEEDLSILQDLVDEWKKRVETRLLNENLPPQDDLAWLENDFLNDVCFVHGLDHQYTVAGWVEKRNGSDKNCMDEFKVLGPHDSGDLSRLIGRDRNVVDLLAKAPVDVMLLLQDYTVEEENLCISIGGSGYQHPLWNVALVLDEDGVDRNGEFRLTTKTYPWACTPGSFQLCFVDDCLCWWLEDTYHHYRVAYLVVRPRL